MYMVIETLYAVGFRDIHNQNVISNMTLLVLVNIYAHFLSASTGLYREVDFQKTRIGISIVLNFKFSQQNERFVRMLHLKF